MRSFLLSCIPAVAFVFAVELLIYSYTGDWPNWWSLVAWICLGFAYGSRRFLP